MIEKYKNELIKNIWDDLDKFSLMESISLLYVEKLSLDLQEEVNLDLNSSLQVNKIKKLEKETKHETVAFLKDLESRLIDPNAKRLLHKDLTSSDLLDTASAIQHKNSYRVLNLLIDRLNRILKRKINKYSFVRQIGRTHSKHAEEICLSDRFRNLFLSLNECNQHLKQSVQDLPGKLSGPVGKSDIHENVRQGVSQGLGIPLSSYAMQIVPRHYYASIAFNIANLATCYEKFCTDIRLLAFNEINEMQEGFSDGQYGSSAMPHKKNPISFERICGLSRLLRQSVSTSLENNVTWFERDISHSSVERINWEDQWHLICYSTALLSEAIDSLTINFENIKNNVDNSQVSQKKLNENLDNFESRFEAYEQTRSELLNSQGGVQAKDVDLFGLSSVQAKT